MKGIVYLDYNASTPVDERVLHAMLPWFCGQYGNPSSKGHPLGWAAEEACEQAREQMAAALGAEPGEIVFTSGATEGANAAIKGVAEMYQSKGRHLVTVQTEHRAVLNAHRALERKGYEVTYLPVDTHGQLDLDALETALRDDTILVSVMWANNEAGTIQPVESVSEMARSRGVLFMTDATQAVGKVPVHAGLADLLVCSAHKFYGPKGVGALCVRRRDPRVRIAPLLDGGGHENGRRSGTLNVPGIVGIGEAAEIACREMEDFRERMEHLQDRLERHLLQLPGAHLNVPQHVPRLPQTSSIRFEGIGGAHMMTACRNLAFSAGSACSSGSGEPSHVLRAMGLSSEQALSTLRLSLGRFTTENEVDHTIAQIGQAVRSAKETAVTSA